MTESKTTMGRSRSVGCLEDHTQAINRDARVEAQLHQLIKAGATMQIYFKGIQDQLAAGLVEVSTVSFISRSFAKRWLATKGCCSGR
jgi:hypothetical protein